MTRLIAIEIETSGLDPEAGFEIIWICAVELIPENQLGKKFQSLVRPLRPLTPEAEKITGITNRMLANSPSFSEIINEFIDFTDGARFVCKGTSFIIMFLNDALQKLKIDKFPTELFEELSE